MARRNSRRSAVSLSTSMVPLLSASTRSSRRTKTACVQSCHRSAGSRALRQHVWQYLVMSVTAFDVGSAVPAALDADAFAGVAASAVPSTIATITLREDRFEGKYRVIEPNPSRVEIRRYANYTDRQNKLSRFGKRKFLQVARRQLG